MILVIDIGNTNIKLGLFDKDILVASWKMSTDTKRTADETGAIILQLFASSNVDSSLINGAIMSSVIPQLNYTMSHALEFYFQLKAIVVEAGVKTGMSIKYENPKELGADRIVNCVGAIKKYKPPFILVDFGTATTYNVVNEKGEFIGGCITAGIKTKMEALANETAQLPRVELIHQCRLVANSTVKALQSGLVLGSVGETKYILARLKEELGNQGIKVIATGGLSQLVCEHEQLFDIVDRELSLDGLYFVYKLNRPNEF